MLVSAMMAAGTLRAASGTWLAASGAGNWTDSTKWSGGIIADGADSTATFQAPSTTGVDSINLNGVDRTIGNLTETGAFSSSNYYTFDGANTLTFSTTTGTAPLITLVGASSGTVMRINTLVAGSTGLKITSSGGTGLGRLLWNPSTMSLTGGIEVNTAVMQVLGATTNLGSNAVTLSGTTADLQFGGNAGTFANNFVLAGTTLSFTAARSSANNFTLSGTISETSGPRSVAFTTSSVVQTAGSVGSITVSGNNSYTGNTTIGVATVLAISNNNALGTGTSSVGFATGSTGAANSLNVSGGITVSNKTLTLGGQGDGANGSLRSTSGTNTWAGPVALGTVANPTIGVDAGTLNISGQITGSATGGLAKTGAGMLVLSVNNTYSTGTQVLAGTLAVGSNTALGSGTVTVGDGTGTDTLRINNGVNAAIGALTLTSSAHLAYDLTSPTSLAAISVSGNQTGTGTYVVDLLSSNTIAAGTYTLLTVGGTNQAAGFALGTTANSASSDSLDWSNGVLTLTVTAVPEPGCALFAVGAIAVGAWMRSRSRRQASV